VLIEVQLLPTADSEYTFSWFFVDQLQAFDVWLRFAVDKRESPPQLPIVLQVLLSQVSIFYGEFRVCFCFF
jgi:regulator-associated protein of mTOR